MTYSSHKKGFTLIELLVVVSIIGLLSSIILASLNTARNRGYDAKRYSDLTAIHTALELYYGSNNAYPDTSSSWRSQCAGFGSYPNNQVIPGLTPTSLPLMPADPQMDIVTNVCCYLYRSNNVDYKFIVRACPTSACYANLQGTTGFSDPARANVCAIYTPGAATW
ncbi:type II secretion system protein [Candidatus Kaiserbacteria bacterium]|nr:type II secretion system protein [Candidatus Kaiserbacteria bacterium]